MQVEEFFDTENINDYDMDGHSRNDPEAPVCPSRSTRQKTQITAVQPLFRAFSRPCSMSTDCAEHTPSEVPVIYKVRVNRPWHIL